MALSLLPRSPLVLLTIKRAVILPAVVLLAAGCATSPLDTSGVTSRATPSEIVGSLPEVRGKRVQWGGHIVSVVNKAQETRIEVLSYPMARNGFPNDYRKPTGRFVLRHDGFLEPRDFAPGRMLTVVGTVDSLVRTSVQDTEFLLPLVHSEQLKLWDQKYGYGDRGRPRFGFGVGVSIGL